MPLIPQEKRRVQIYTPLATHTHSLASGLKYIRMETDEKYLYRFHSIFLMEMGAGAGAGQPGAKTVAGQTVIRKRVNRIRK